MARWEVSRHEGGQKLIAFLSDRVLPGTSRRYLKRLIEANCCEVDGEKERFASRSLRPGQRVTFEEGAPEKLVAFQKVLSIDVLYEDESCLVINKPAGVVCDAQDLLRRLSERWPRLSLVHRLDRETTGALLLAKTEACGQALEALFRAREVSKEYLAFLEGVPPESSGVMRDFVGKVSRPGEVLRWGVVERGKGKEAHTRWERLQVRGHVSLVRCYPTTGRTHQLRVQWQARGCPILGDFHYCRRFQGPYRPERVLLHAAKLSFIHPEQRCQLVIEAAPFPDFFAAAEVMGFDEKGLA